MSEEADNCVTSDKSQHLNVAEVHPATHPCHTDYNERPELTKLREKIIAEYLEKHPHTHSQKNTTNPLQPQLQYESSANNIADENGDESTTADMNQSGNPLDWDSDDEEQQKFKPIEEHGIIGNMRTCALISTDAYVQWFCYPHFDSPSIFGSLLDPEKGGHFSIKVVTHRANNRKYHRQKSANIVNDYASHQQDERDENIGHFTTLSEDEEERKQLREKGENDNNNSNIISQTPMCSSDDESEYKRRHSADNRMGNKKSSTVDMPILERTTSTATRFRINRATSSSRQPSQASSHVVHKQLYHSESNILVTRFLAKTGVAHVRDFMPVGRGCELAQGWLIREVEVVRGSMCFEVDCLPAFNYGRDSHSTEINERGAKFISKASVKECSTGLVMLLTSSSPRKWRICDDGGVVCRLRLKEGDKETFVFRSAGTQTDTDDGTEEKDVDAHCIIKSISSKQTDIYEQRTIEYWRSWLAKCTYTGRWREYVHRSALVLKLLTFEPTGAMVSAPTTSLPELSAGVKNHDYRYTWVRDGSFVIYSFIKLGFTDEARAFIRWCQRVLKDSKCEHVADSLQNMYGLHGEREIKEEELWHWSGYRNSRPVRIGNSSYKQFQLDIYGVAMDTLYLASKYAQPISWGGWQHLRRIVDWVCVHWMDPDHSIWGQHDDEMDESIPKALKDTITLAGKEQEIGIGKKEHSERGHNARLHHDVELRAKERQVDVAKEAAGITSHLSNSEGIRGSGQSVWSDDIKHMNDTRVDRLSKVDNTYPKRDDSETIPITNVERDTLSQKANSSFDEQHTYTGQSNSHQKSLTNAQTERDTDSNNKQSSRNAEVNQSSESYRASKAANAKSQFPQTRANESPPRSTQNQRQTEKFQSKQSKDNNNASSNANGYTGDVDDESLLTRMKETVKSTLKDTVSSASRLPQSAYKFVNKITTENDVHFDVDRFADKNKKQYKNASDRPDHMKTPGCRSCYAGEHHEGNSVEGEHIDRDRQQYTYSKLMCWVAVDRGIRLAQKRSLPADLARWLYTRNQIYEYILDKCWNEERQAFVQAAGSDKLDSSLLLMPSFFFVTPTDPRFVSTLETVFQSASKGGLVSNNLVYRYSSSDKVDAATYSVCTFWAVEAASRLGMFEPQWLERARLMFEQMLGYANHLRIFSEQVGLRGEHIGNFPHAFTHLSLISSAFNLDRALSGGKEPYLMKT